MSERRAISNGNANDPLIWDGGTLPAVGDAVFANGFDVTVTVSVTWLSANTIAGTVAVAGGKFILLDGVTLTATVLAGSTPCVQYTGTAGGAASIIGDVTGGTIGGAYGVLSDGDGVLTIVGAAVGTSTPTVPSVVGNGTSPITISRAKLGPTGVWPVQGRIVFANPASAMSFEVRNAALTTKTLVANRYAIVNGNWSSTATWNGGILPVAGDAVYANGKTVTVDINITVASLNTTAGIVAVAGGTFNVGNGITINANSNAGSTSCIVVSGVAGNLTTINGNITGSSTTNAFRGIVNNSAGNVIVTGAVTGGIGGTTSHGIQHAGTGVLTVNGTCTGGAGSHGVVATSGSGNLIVNGNCVGGTSGSACGVSAVGTGNVTITGDCTGGVATNNRGLWVQGSGIILVNGSCFGTEGPGILTSGSSNITVTGNATGGTATNANSSAGITDTGTGQITLQGFAIGSTTGFASAPGVSGAGALPIIIGGAKSSTGCSPINGKVVRSTLAGAQVEVRDSFLCPLY